MPVLVEQFFDKPRRKYACGEKRAFVSGQNVLRHAFAVSSKENGADEKQVFGMLLAVACKTPTGKKVPDDVSRLGYSFSFESGMDKGGCCYPAVYREKAALGFPMLPVYEKEPEASGDAGKARKASFKAWYGCAAYRDNREFIDYLLKGCTAEDDPTAFQVPISSREILKICPNGKRPYVDPGFPETPEAFSIPAGDKADISKKMELCASSVKGASADVSVMRMYSRDGEENILPHSARSGAAAAVWLNKAA